MRDYALTTKKLSKQYRLGLIGTGSLGDDLKRAWAKIRGKEDPFKLIGDSNDRTSKGNSNYVWALKDINLEVFKGEVLGIIGKNGAGKSTLLKILSRITSPSYGEVSYEGRIGSLLEVGTGFHPELTGRENIFLNGAILGMSKREVSEKLNEIIEFAGIQKYINTPVKRYSSGMIVRLGFAVAAHLEPEILIVDEVLAVGDIEFQKKCLGKMKDISRGDGRTILFVSHNLGAISTLCDRVAYLKDGELVCVGETQKVISQYLESESSRGEMYFDVDKSKIASIASIRTLNNQNCCVCDFDVSEGIDIEVEYEVQEDVRGIVLALILENDAGPLFYTFNNEVEAPIFNHQAGRYRSCYKVPKLLLKPGKYYLTLNLGMPGELLEGLSNIISFDVLEGSVDPTNLGWRRDRPGTIIHQGVWKNGRI